ncbi:MAG TPA: hypothetical protein DCL73_05930 [Treponema sp.]|nr:hypothetical protein [Treponema sp.]
MIYFLTGRYVLVLYRRIQIAQIGIYTRFARKVKTLRKSASFQIIIKEVIIVFQAKAGFTFSGSTFCNNR